MNINKFVSDEIKSNWRELAIIALGILVVITPFFLFAGNQAPANVIFGAAIVILAAWPFYQKARHNPEY